MERVPQRPLLPVSSWVGSVWALREAKGAVTGEVQAVNGELVSLAIVRKKIDSESALPTESNGRVVRVSTKSLLNLWEHVDRGRAGFWSRYRPVR